MNWEDGYTYDMYERNCDQQEQMERREEIEWIIADDVITDILIREEN